MQKTSTERLRCVLFACVVVSLGSTLAHAQTERELLQSAREAMERGQELYVASNYAEAATAFLLAYESRPFSAFLYNAGIAYENAGSSEEAIDLYGRYLEAEPDASDAEDVRARIARLSPQPTTDPTGDPTTDPACDPATDPSCTPTTDPACDPATDPACTPTTDPTTDPTGDPAPALPAVQMKSLLSIETNPSDATITLRRGDEEYGRGQSPFAQTLDEGEYEISVDHPDYRTITRTMRIRPGKVYVAVLELSQGEFLGYLQVITEPPGADVYIDDRSQGAVGQTPFMNPLLTGEHHVWVERPGYQTLERDVEVTIGDTHKEEVELERVTYGRIRVLGNLEGAKVHVDGREVGAIPYDGEVEAGPHEIVVSHDGMKDWEQQVTIERGQLTPMRVTLRPAVSRAPAWITMVLGLGGIAGGIVLGLQAESIRDELRDDRDVGLLARNDNRFRRGKTMAALANAAWGFAGLMGLLSLYYFIRDPLPDSSADVLEPRDWTFTPILSPTMRAGGAQLDWRF